MQNKCLKVLIHVITKTLFQIQYWRKNVNYVPKRKQIFKEVKNVLGKTSVVHNSIA